MNESTPSLVEKKKRRGRIRGDFNTLFRELQNDISTLHFEIDDVQDALEKLNADNYVERNLKSKLRLEYREKMECLKLLNKYRCLFNFIRKKYQE
jgi:hypothetical protein